MRERSRCARGDRGLRIGPSDGFEEMPEKNVEIVRRGYAMFSAGDIEGVAAMFADDAEIPDGGGLGVGDSAEGMRVGPEGFLRTSPRPRRRSRTTR